MADAIFDRRGKLRDRLAELRHDEEGIVAESSVASRPLRDPSSEYSLGDRQ